MNQGCNNNCNKSCNKSGCLGPGFAILMVLLLCCLIFYQLIITFIFPFRFNLFILFLEVALLFYFLTRIVWPY